jgi:hypothetical protein
MTIPSAPRLSPRIARLGAHLAMLCFVALACQNAWAYIGPGAGVSFLGSLWAILVGIVLALAAILFWPIRWMLRRMRRRTPPTDGTPGD